jgi:hypothetical protein
MNLMRTRFTAGLCVISLILVSGCVTAPKMADVGITGSSLELSNTAFFPDERRQAGPAALATLLYTDGVDVGPDAVLPLLRTDVGERTPQADLIAATLSLNRIPTVLEPTYASLIAELRAGRPVMVLMVDMPPDAPADWRYAVVVGVQPELDRFILRSGRTGRRFLSYDQFEKAWSPGHHWAMVVTRADELPATVSADLWIAAADAVTQAKKPQLAETMVTTGVAKWGETTTSWVALGNARYAQRDLVGASRAYRKAIELKPDNAVAHNNYAEVLLDRHCIDNAQDQIDAALKLETDPQLIERFEGTQVMIRKHAGPSVYCPELADGDVAPTRYEGAPVDLNALPARPARRVRKPKKPQ